MQAVVNEISNCIYICRFPFNTGKDLKDKILDFLMYFDVIEIMLTIVHVGNHSLQQALLLYLIIGEGKLLYQRVISNRNNDQNYSNHIKIHRNIDFVMKTFLT